MDEINKGRRLALLESQTAANNLTTAPAVKWPGGTGSLHIFGTIGASAVVTLYGSLDGETYTAIDSQIYTGSAVLTTFTAGEIPVKAVASGTLTTASISCYLQPSLTSGV
jgi:hypothetical protein